MLRLFRHYKRNGRKRSNKKRNSRMQFPNSLLNVLWSGLMQTIDFFFYTVYTIGSTGNLRCGEKLSPFAFFLMVLSLLALSMVPNYHWLNQLFRSITTGWKTYVGALSTGYRTC